MDKNQQARLLRLFLFHAGFWAAYLLFNGIAWNAFDGSYMTSSLQGLLFLPVKMIIVYLNFYWLLPYYLFRKKYFIYVVLLSAMIIAGSLQQHLLLQLSGVHNTYDRRPGNGMFNILLQHAVPINSIVFFTTMIRLIQQWYKQERRSALLEKEQMRNELSFLKSQVQPHFLFNTLNNLYALTLKQSAEAPLVVLKLSELLSYTLYEAGAGRVLLEREVSYIRSYIDIERLRYGDDMAISLNISGNLAGVTIEPMLLLPFIENCFKHGAGLRLGSAWISIAVNVKGGMLVFKAENSKSPVPGSQDQGGGIGLRNVKRRLDLLYQDRYQLEITDESEYFSIDLKLRLD